MVSRREALLSSAAVAGGAALLQTGRAQADVSGARAWEASYSGTKPGHQSMPIAAANRSVLVGVGGSTK